MPLNALKLIYCKFHIAQKIDIENIDNIIKGALEIFLSVLASISFASFSTNIFSKCKHNQDTYKPFYIYLCKIFIQYQEQNSNVKPRLCNYRDVQKYIVQFR